MEGKRGARALQLTITNCNFLRNERAGTCLVVNFGVDGHIQRMHREDALAAEPLGLVGLWSPRTHLI